MCLLCCRRCGIRLCRLPLCVPSPLFDLYIWVSSKLRPPSIWILTPHVIVPMGCITSWLLALCALARVTTTLCSCLKPTPHLVVAMVPCHVSSFLDATPSHGIAPMTPYPCMRHCALMCHIPRHFLSWLCCCDISMLHPSNRPWHCTHVSSSCLAQGIAPLCHCQEESLHHALCHCSHRLHTTTCCGAHVWVPTRFALWALLMSEAKHQGTKPPYLNLSHLPPPPFSSVSLLKSISGWFRSFWRRHHSCLRRNNEPV